MPKHVVSEGAYAVGKVIFTVESKRKMYSDLTAKQMHIRLSPGFLDDVIGYGNEMHANN